MNIHNFFTRLKSFKSVRAAALITVLLMMPIVSGGCGGSDDSSRFNGSTQPAAVVCDIPAVYFGEKPKEDFYSALNERFTNHKDALDGSVGIVILYSPYLKGLSSADLEKIRERYDNGATIVIGEPTHGELEGFLKAIDHSAVMDSEAQYETVDVYAFNNKGLHYFMGDKEIVDYEDKSLTLEERFGFALDPMVTWLNENTLKEKKALAVARLTDAEYAKLGTSRGEMTPVSVKAADTPADVRETFNYTKVTFDCGVGVRGELAHVALSDPDVLERHGTITVTTYVYPLYAFEDQASPGDYYIVSQTVSSPNESWYNGTWTSRHGGVHVRLCGWYMKSLRVRNTIDAKGHTHTLDSSKPETTVGQTTYTNGMSWNIGGSVTGGGSQEKGGELSATVTGGVTFSDTTTRVISDIDVLNLSSGTTAAYGINFNNPSTFGSLSRGIDPPALPSRSTQQLFTNFIWHVGGTKDNDANDQFAMTIALGGGYWEGSHFYSSAADFSYVTQGPLDDKPATRTTFNLPRPSRVPTGLLHIENLSGAANVNLKEIKMTDAKNAKSFTFPDTVPPGKAAEIWLPAGDYEIQLIADSGSTKVTMKATKSTTRGATSNIYYPADFSQQ